MHTYNAFYSAPRESLEGSFAELLSCQPTYDHRGNPVFWFKGALYEARVTLFHYAITAPRVRRPEMRRDVGKMGTRAEIRAVYLVGLVGTKLLLDRAARQYEM